MSREVSSLPLASDLTDHQLDSDLVGLARLRGMSPRFESQELREKYILACPPYKLEAIKYIKTLFMLTAKRKALARNTVSLNLNDFR